MSLDPMPIYLAAQRWRHSEHLHLPRNFIEPVVWVTDKHALAMYHPALRLNLRTPSMEWTRTSFLGLVANVLPTACGLIDKAIAEEGMPGGFYTSYPDHVRTGTFGSGVGDDH